MPYILLFFNRTILKESGFARYLHSAVLMNGAMLVFGGNTHNDTSLSNGAKCFSADFLAYDIGRYKSKCLKDWNSKFNIYYIEYSI